MSADNKQKKAKFSPKDIFTNKRFRYGGFSLIMIAIVIAVVILVNVGVTAIEGNWNLTADVTVQNMFKISAQTTEILKELDEPIRFIALYPETTASEQTTVRLTELLNRYRQINPDMIEIESIDTVRQPTYARQFDTAGEGISDNSVVVTNADGSRFRVVDAADMYEYDYDMQTYERYTKAFIGEQAITNAVVFVSSAEQHRVFFLTEHNEVPFAQYSSYIQGPIEQLNIEVAEMGIRDLGELREGDILVINSPQRDLSADERDQLKAFLAQGGKMIYLRNAGDAQLDNFDSLLELYGVTVNHDLVIESDQSKNQMGNQTIIIPDMTTNAITDTLRQNNLVPVMPLVSSFEISPVAQSNRTIEVVLSTSDTAFGKVDLDDPSTEFAAGDLPGPRTVALSIEQTEPTGAVTQIVAFGNSHFVSMQDFAAYSGNLDLFFGAIRWMQGESSAVSIVGKSLLGSRLNLSSTMQIILLAALVVVVIPLVLVIAGLVIWLRRRHL